MSDVFLPSRNEVDLDTVDVASGSDEGEGREEEKVDDFGNNGIGIEGDTGIFLEVEGNGLSSLISRIDTLFNSESLLRNRSLDGDESGDEDDFFFNKRKN